MAINHLIGETFPKAKNILYSQDLFGFLHLNSLVMLLLINRDRGNIQKLCAIGFEDTSKSTANIGLSAVNVTLTFYG